MTQSSGNYSTMIQLVAAIVAIISTIGGGIFAAIKAFKHRKFNVASYYVSRGVFADRKDSLRTLISTLQSDVRVVNIYGKRGIGKSAFLCFFCDYVNRKLNRENAKIAKELPKIRGRAVYIHVSGNGDPSLDKQILEQVGGHCSSLSDAAEWIMQVVKHQKIFIVIDNINNAGLSKEIEAVIDIFLSRSDRFKIVVGSIEKQPFLNIFSEKHIQRIELSVFEAEDVFEFAEKNSKNLSQEDISKVIDFTEGLPVFVSLLLSNDNVTVPFITHDKDRMSNYLGRIIDDLEPATKIVAQYIGFLSVTRPIFPVRMLNELGLRLSTKCLEELENCSLIEFDNEMQTIKMHELFRDFICHRFSTATDIIQKLYEYYCNKDLLYEQTYYLIMLEGVTHDCTINQAVQKAIDEENFAFLLMLGEHYKRLYGLRKPTINLSEETFLTIIYGYLEGLIGVGSYPSAQEVIDKCKISARSPKSDLHFRFSILTAHLYHLQNKYDESIATYQALLGSLQEGAYKKYKAKCLWGIAHALRHQGKNFDAAIQFYNESIAVAEEMGAESEVIKSMREKLVIFQLRNQKEEACELHYQICFKVNQLPPTGYKGTRISFLKSEASYIATTKTPNTKLEYTILMKVLNAYKAQRKRLQYNMFFQLGEHFRRLKNYASAKENYNKALSFSKQNLDHNLETLSTIAIAICDFCFDSLTDSTEDTLIQCLEVCQEFDLHVNMLLAEMLLAYVRNEHVDGQTIQELETIRYKKAIHACKHMSKANLCSLDLFLM